MYKFPIEEYEKDIEANFSSQKKKEIHNLLINSNNFHSEEEFKEIENKLHKACRMGDIELIKIYLSESIQNDTKDLTFKIDRTTKTSSLFNVNYNLKQLIVPRTVQHETIEYLVTSITGTNNVLKSIQFAKNSEIKTIYSGAISSSSITRINFPASLKELKEGWCNGAKNIKTIKISPSNDQFVFKDDKYLLGKTDPNSNEFDNLLFVSHDIKEFYIPSYIKMISSYVFSGCFSLTKVDIPPFSNLQTIGSYAFSGSKIKEIYFPESLKILKEGWCNNLHNLTKIKISPSNHHFVFKDGKYLLGKTDPNSDEFDNLLFVIYDVKKISIPSNIKIISSYAFFNCKNLAKVEIQPDSNLQTIGSYAFYDSKIKEIFIPQKVSKICENAFYNCQNLIKVEFLPNSNLKSIESYAFAWTKIEKIVIPPKIPKICGYTFFNCKNLTKVEISPNSNLEKIDSHSFAWSQIERIFIPQKVSLICKEAFSSCRNLEKVKFAPNSNLQIIESNAFSLCNIKCIFIPSKVSKICECVFLHCTNLQIVEISGKSELESFPLSAFTECPNVMIMIPFTLKKLIQKNESI